MARCLAHSRYLTDGTSGPLPRGSALSRIHPVPASCAPPKPTCTCHSPLVPLPGTQGPLSTPLQPQYTTGEKDGATALKGWA